MRIEEFIRLYGDLPVIESVLLNAGIKDTGGLKVQINRWVKTGKLIQLKRGIYILDEPFRKKTVFEPHLASVLQRPSYISLEKALEYHGLIPEAVPVYTSVTTKRQSQFSTKPGVFVYRHIKEGLFWGYESVTMDKQTGFIATPEKALLDLFYLNNTAVSPEYLDELRLQNLENIDINKLQNFAKRFDKSWILRASEALIEYIKSRRREVSL